MSDGHSYGEIMARCLNRAENNVDKREGSILYDALAPACAELAALYTEVETMLDRAWPDTAAGEDLDRKVRERAVRRQEATFAVRRGRFYGADGGALDVPVGTRLSGGTLNFAVSVRTDAGDYRLTAETAGRAGNTYFGTLFPIDYVEGLATAVLEDVLVPGDDREDDESLRARYFGSFNTQAFGGNAADYREKIGAMDGVGGVKVFRTPAGGGTVRCVLVDSLWRPPSAELVARVQQAVDPAGHAGEGVGLAPIGHAVTVAGCAGVEIAVDFSLTLEEGVSWENVKAAVTAAIQGYFDGLTQGWAGSSGLIVRVSQVETRVLAVPGVVDIQGTALNGSAGNLALGAEEIPTLGEVRNASA